VQQAWFIFTFLLLLCTLKSTVAFFMLFFTLDLAFLMLGIGHLQLQDGKPNSTLIHAGGGFGLLAAFLAWYNALAGIADTSNRYVAADACFSLLCRSTQRCSDLGQDFTMVECSLTVLLLQLLHRSRRTLPVVREGSGSAHGQQDGLGARRRLFRGGTGRLEEDEDSVHAAHCVSLAFLKLVGKPPRLLLIDLRQSVRNLL
jgi:hypothetical protein